MIVASSATANLLKVHDYLALSARNAIQGRDELIHIVRQDAEAALCGIPRTSLGPSCELERMCPDCMVWASKPQPPGQLGWERES